MLDYKNCRWCKHFENGKCFNIGESLNSFKDDVMYAYENSDVTTDIEERNLAEKLFNQLTQYMTRKSAKENESEILEKLRYFFVDEVSESCLKSILSGSDYVEKNNKGVKIEDPENFVCSNFR